LENGEKRIVNIRFHVDADGAVTNFQIVQSGGAAFDNEVIRVLKRMPNWMPAQQAGKAVAVSFTQPVTFVGAEE
jgi:protein TonB